MKSLLSFIVLLISTLNVVGQDVIYTTSGREVKCKIISELDSIVYFDFKHNGAIIPTQLAKSKIEKIVYSSSKKNGQIYEKDNAYFVEDNELTSNEFKSLIKTNPSAYAHFRSAKSTNVMAQVFSGTSGYLLGSALFNNTLSSEAKTYRYASSAVALVLAFAINSGAKSQLNKAIETYNASIAGNSLHYSPIKVEFGITPNGVGLLAKF